MMEQADWDKLKQQMDSPWGIMKLQCDGFEVTLRQETSTKRKSWETTVYVNGAWKGAWLFSDDDGNPTCEEARRFLRKQTRKVYSAKKIAEYRKVFGKREADKLAAKASTIYIPGWTNFNSLKKHLEANNKEIRVLH